MEAVAARSDQTELEQLFSLFVSTHRERARRLAWRLVGGDEGAADDVAQEAFVKAYQGLGKFRQEASLDTWFYRWTYDLLAFNEPLTFPQGSLESAEFDETDDNDQAELLPDEYLAIEHIFLDG